MLFWITVAALAVLVGATLAIGLLRGRVAGERPAAAYDLEVYRDQLREVDRDQARGVVSEDEAERLRTEVGRRILAADAALKVADGRRDGRGGRAAPFAAGGLAVLVVGGALFLYTELGAPGYADLPLKLRLANAQKLAEERLSQDRAEARAELPKPDLSQVPKDYLTLVKRLRQVVETRPDDQRGLSLLAQNEGRLGNWSAAREAQQKLIAAKGNDATADDYATLADMMINAAGGYVSKDAADAVETALKIDPQQPLARYFLGLYSLQVDRPDKTFELWQALLDDSKPDAPWVTSLRAQLPQVAQRAGVQRYQLPPMPGAAPGPDAAAMAAAGQMSVTDRQQMIAGMVAKLDKRLADQGGSAQEWARLVNAYRVLGEGAKVQKTLEAARKALADQPDALAMVEAAAKGGSGPRAGSATLPGPDAAQVQAAGQMSAADRKEMIAGMVEKLAGRLEMQGGSGQEWARLVTSYGVLGEPDKARAALLNARKSLADQPEELRIVNTAARDAGITLE